MPERCPASQFEFAPESEAAVWHNERTLWNLVADPVAEYQHTKYLAFGRIADYKTLGM